MSHTLLVWCVLVLAHLSAVPGLKCIVNDGINDETKVVCTDCCCYWAVFYYGGNVVIKKDTFPTTGQDCDQSDCTDEEKRLQDVTYKNYEPISCKRCSGDSCNEHPTIDIPSCYECEGCDVPGEDTTKKYCRGGYKNCYAAQIFRSPNSDSIVIRGCSNYLDGTVVESREYIHKLYSKKGWDTIEILNFDNCENHVDNCNAMTYVVPKCHSCTGDGCKKDKTTWSTKKSERHCCYSAARMLNDRLVYDRGVATVGYSDCEQYCTLFKGMIACESCRDDLCNNKMLPSVVKCFSCSLCEDPTGVVYSLKAEDCYAAVIGGDHTTNYMVRGVVPSSNTRGNPCGAIKNAQPDGRQVVWCQSCKISDMDGCNGATMAVPSIQCYSCDGAACDNRDIIGCESLCCFTQYLYGKNGFRTIKGCATEKGMCGRYCEARRSSSKPDMDELHCSSCYSNLCNNQQRKSVSCYSCTNCDTIDGNTPSVPCMSKQCCYSVAIYNEKAFGMWTVDRGCIAWEPNLVCREYSTYRRIKALYGHLYHDGVVCLKTDADNNCNGKDGKEMFKYTNCHVCNGTECNVVEATFEKCVSSCCYIYSSFRMDHSFVERGCAHYGACDSYCKYLREKAPEDSEVLSCATCGDNKCNDNTLPKIPKCYSCDNCNSVTKDTPVVDCRAPECCYTVYLKTHNHHHVSRGCIPWRVGLKCYATKTCLVAKTYLKKRYVDATIEKCETCNVQNDLAVCNGVEYIPDSIKCYQCNEPNCATERLVNCAHKCCLATTAFGEDGASHGKFCGEDLWDCSHYCDHYKQQFALKRPNEELTFCKSCSDDQCNDRDVLRSAFSCYKCHGEDCNSVTTATDKVDNCRSAECCYTAYVSETEYGVLHAERSCMAWSYGLVCNTLRTCKYAKDKYLTRNPNGRFGWCETCNKKDGSLCNNKAFTPSSIECYNCTGSSCTVDNTNKVTCFSKCCYSVGGYWNDGVTHERGCSKDIQACNTYCKDYEDKFIDDYPGSQPLSCIACSTNLCNQHELPSPFYCHSCENCNTIKKSDTMVPCRGAKCCYTVYENKEANQPLYATRGCIKLNSGQQCNRSETCNKVKQVFRRRHRQGVVGMCKACYNNEGDGCNNEGYQPPSIKCYECNDEGCVTVQPNTHRRECLSNCCYSATTFGKHTGVVNERGCAADMRTCETYCDHYRELKKKLKSIHEVISCLHCTTDSCNDAKLQPKFYCYSCNDCNELEEADKRTVECSAAECCYWAILRTEEHAPYHAVRGCVSWTLGLKCNSQTINDHLVRNYEGARLDKWIACKPTDESLCNSHTYVPPMIKCYECEGESCWRAPKDNTTNCLSMCCFSAAHYGESGYWYKRGCAERPCNTWRSHYKSLNPTGIKYMHCNEDHCNYEPLPNFKCYKCEDCNRVTPQTNLTDCFGPECCYTSFTHRKHQPLYATRDCVKLALGLKCDSETTKKYAESLHTNSYRRDTGSFGGTIVCQPNSTSGCNNVHYEMTSSRCYICNGVGCDEVNHEVDCINQCCYSLTFYGSSGRINERGCTDMEPCHSYCQQKLDSYTNQQQIFCETCSTNLCNNHTLRNKFTCHQCTNCNEINSSTPSPVECMSPLCCYTVFTSESEDSPLYANRGCLPWAFGQNCSQENTCATVRTNLAHVHNCTVCNEGDGSNCNSQPYAPPIYCYSCTDTCNNIDLGTTPYEICESRVCYSASTYGTNGQENTRGCATNLTFCDKLKNTSIRDVLYCLTCDTHRCNYDELDPPLECYECDPCNTVDNATRTTSCVSASNCYTIHIRPPYGNIHVQRGCTEWTYKAATKYPAEVCSQLLTNNPAITHCRTCDEVDGHRCNADPYTPSPMCYVCLNCPLPSPSDLVKCPTQCCIATTTYNPVIGLQSTRECAASTDNCDTFCNNTYLPPNRRTQRTYCRTCSYFGCNNQLLATPFKCYRCPRCNTVSPTMLSPCLSPTCCYWAYIQNTETDVYSVTRGCLEGGCNDNVCAQVELDHLSKHPRGDFEACTTCTHTSPSGCNDEPYSPAFMNQTHIGVRCYKCRNCNEVQPTTPQVTCPEAKCCYRAVVADYPNTTLSAIRGCVRPSTGSTCDDTCEIVERRRLIAYPSGIYHTCLTCDEDAVGPCNHNKFDIPEFSEFFRRNIPIQCYQCRNCSRVSSATSNTRCDSAECCYSTQLRDSETEGYYVVRDCADWDPSGNCSQACSDVVKRHIAKHKRGSVKTCVTCKEGAGHECNNLPYPTKAAARNISCYQCSNCNKVIATTGRTECANTECCYRALQKLNAVGPLVAVRGCAKLAHGQTCNNTCKHLQGNYYSLHPQGLFHVCIQCQPQDGDWCNDRPFLPTDTLLERDVGVLCYDCRNCSRVTAVTPTIMCRDARCCYAVYVRDHPYTGYYALRGCSRIRRGKTCLDTCRDIEADFLWEHPLGKFTKCSPCRPNDGDRCNKYRYLPPRVTTRAPYHFAALTTCYKCHNCDVVDQDTPTTLCAVAECCYTAVLRDAPDESEYVKRGCAKHEDGCLNICEGIQKKHIWASPKGVFISCTTCNREDPDRCNNQPYTERPPTLGVPKNLGLLCYNCSNCYQIQTNTPKVKCSQPTCCYTAVVTDRTGNSIVIRGCAVINQCSNTCRHVTKTQLAKHPRGTLNLCLTCNLAESDGCNKNLYHVPTYTQPSPYIVRAQRTPTRTVTCYKCNNCNKITTATDTVHCEPSCCYIALVQNEADGSVSTARGCATNCLDACQWFNDQYRMGYTDSTVQFCRTCNENDEDNCNKHISPP